jgi:hypothetical protein
MKVMTVFTHYQNGWPRFQRVPVWFAVEKASISCSFRRRKLAALATTFVWVSSVLSREGRHASVELVTPFLATLPPRILVATITKVGAPLLEPVLSVEDAKEPSRDIDAFCSHFFPDGMTTFAGTVNEKFPSYVAHTGYPRLWIMHCDNHFAAALVDEVQSIPLD